MLKAPGYQMVEENSKYAHSYFYQIDHASKKSFFNILQLGFQAPHMRQPGLPGENEIKNSIKTEIITFKFDFRD